MDALTLISVVVVVMLVLIICIAPLIGLLAAALQDQGHNTTYSKWD